MGMSIRNLSSKAGAGRTRERSASGAERFAGRSASSVAVGVAEEEVVGY
jgi:hypothetical protein